MSGHDHATEVALYGDCITCARADRAEQLRAAEPLSLAAGRALRDVAVARVERNADDDWKAEARRTIEQLARERSEFTSDAVWELGLSKPREARALGAIMRWAQNERLIEATERVDPTAQPNCHARPIRVWRSLLHSD